jgi:hypothetical protein
MDFHNANGCAEYCNCWMVILQLWTHRNLFMRIMTADCKSRLLWDICTAVTCLIMYGD